ncbi:hypothetical protein [Natronorarus salvus]|uniref:hypothetical protein n=1 Tax=Natronorarus salvus TaxID=3117733 RepID=UPI002F265BB2
MQTNTPTANESSDERRPTDRPLDGARSLLRATLLDDRLPEFEVYQALCECSLPRSITDLEERR